MCLYGLLPKGVELVVVSVGGEVVHQDLLPVLLCVGVDDGHVHVYHTEPSFIWKDFRRPNISAATSRQEFHLGL